jgi:hypothetical protein
MQPGGHGHGHGHGGGGGGGGFGAGGKSGAIPLGGAGGAGGGSYAYKGDEPPSASLPAFGRPGRGGSLIVVVDDVGSSAIALNATRACRFAVPPAAARTRWICTYRASGRPGYAQVKFTLRRR